MKMYKIMFHYKPHNVYGQLKRMDQDEAFLELHPECEDMYTYDEYLDIVKSETNPDYEYSIFIWLKTWQLHESCYIN